MRLAASRDRPSHDAGAVVRVKFPHSLFDLLEEGGPAFGNQCDFRLFLYLALSAVDRVRPGNYVDASGEPFRDQGVSNHTGHVERRSGDVEGGYSLIRNSALGL